MDKQPKKSYSAYCDWDFYDASLMVEYRQCMEEGKDADIVLCDEDFNIIRTISRGRTIYSA